MNILDPIDFETPAAGDLYDELPLWSAPFGLWILERCPLRAGQTVLDLGSGTGFLAIELAERCGPAATVLAVDPWHAAMERLRRKIAYRGNGNIRLLEQDAAAIDLPPASLDLIVSNLGVNNFDDPGAVLGRCARAARPGAEFLLTTNVVGHMAEFYEVYRQVLLQTGQDERLPVLEAHVQHRATAASVTALLQGHGFDVTEVHESAFRLRFADGSALLRHHFIRLGFVQGWKGVATPGREVETFAALESALNARAARIGELSLNVPMACVRAHRSTAQALP